MRWTLKQGMLPLSVSNVVPNFETFLARAEGLGMTMSPAEAPLGSAWWLKEKMSSYGMRFPEARNISTWNRDRH